jgi:hypothetical protein
VFCADATWTLFRRVMQGHNPLVPHRRFWFHRALDLGLSHSRLVWRVLGLDAVLFLMAVASLMMDQPWLSLVAGSVLMVLVGLNIRQAEAFKRLEKADSQKTARKK